MRNKILAIVPIFFILFILVISSSGCQTIKGMFKGAAEGAAKDWGFVEDDEWLKE